MSKIERLSHELPPLPLGDLERSSEQLDFGQSHLKTLNTVVLGQEYVIHQPGIDAEGNIVDERDVVRFTRVTQDYFLEGKPFNDTHSPDSVTVFNAPSLGLSPYRNGTWNMHAWVEKPESDWGLTQAKIDIIFDRALEEIADIHRAAPQNAVAAFWTVINERIPKPEE